MGEYVHNTVGFPGRVPTTQRPAENFGVHILTDSSEEATRIDAQTGNPPPESNAGQAVRLPPRRPDHQTQVYVQPLATAQLRQGLPPPGSSNSKGAAITIFLDRILRATRLDWRLYEEVKADPSALRQAMGVVILSGLAGGIGLVRIAGVEGMLIGTIGSLLGWYLWALLTYLLGTKLLPEPQTQADHGELLRTIGFSSAPGLIRILAILPGLNDIVNFIAGAWMLIAMVIAVRQALDYQSTYRAMAVCLISWLIEAVLLWTVLAMTGIAPPGTLPQG